MRKKTIIKYLTSLSIIFFVCINSASAYLLAEENVTGYEIQTKVSNRYTGDDGRSPSTMYLKNKAGHVRTRQFIRSYKDYDGLKKSVIRITYPPDIRLTAFLVWEHKDVDTQFLYLPALKQVKRIAMEDRDQSFVGSDFTLYDLGNIEVDDYTYTGASTEILDGRSCWYYESTKAPAKNPPYSKMQVWVDKEYLIRVKMIYYDKKGKLLKQFTASEIRLTQGIWTVYRFFMENLQDGHSTELIMNAMYYNTGVPDEYFNNSDLPVAADVDFDVEVSE